MSVACSSDSAPAASCSRATRCTWSTPSAHPGSGRVNPGRMGEELMCNPYLATNMRGPTIASRSISVRIAMSL